MEQLLLIFCMLKKKKIYRAYVSKNNSNSEKQAILLTIPNGQRCKAEIHGREAKSKE